MFQLTDEEYNSLRSKNLTLNGRENKITTITKINDNNIFHNMIDNLLENKKLILT